MERCFGDYYLRVTEDGIPQISYDKRKSWQNVDTTSAVENIILEMRGVLVSSFNVTVPNYIKWSIPQDVLIWNAEVSNE